MRLGRDTLESARERQRDGPLASPEEWTDALPAGRFAAPGRPRASQRQHAVGSAGRQPGDGDTGSRLVLRRAEAPRAEGRRSPLPVLGARAAKAVTARARGVQLVALGAPNRRSPTSCTSPRHRVHAHVRNAMTKLGARSRAYLVARGGQPASEAGCPGARAGSEDETITTMTMTATMTAMPILRGVMWRLRRVGTPAGRQGRSGCPDPTGFR